jgi:DNA-binding NarL/FixJ family response regulator
MTEDLTGREREALALLLRGLCNKEIARAMGITEGTVKLHLHAIYNKTGVRSRVKLMATINAFASAQSVTGVEVVVGSPKPGVK